MEMIKALGGADFKQTIECPVIKNLTVQEMQDAATCIGHSLGALPAIALEGHGVYAWGPSPLAALAIVEALEFCCQTQAYSQNPQLLSNNSSPPPI
jgi:ribulose-5-phosphate 4-epimerase/fuculose-1-phosphate aldolase